jgi:hypothetical protein
MQIEIDGVELKNASVNTVDLIEGMSLQGNLGELFLKSHGVDLTPETAVLNELTLKDANLKLCLADTTAQDTTQSTPTFWKFKLEKIDLANVDFQMDMPLDSMNLGLKVGNASLRDGLVDLHKAAYSAKEFKLLQSGLYYNSGNTPPIEKGLDPSHIAVTDINLQMDSLYYQGNNIRALLHQFELKERSGLEIKSTEGQLQADEKAIRVPSLQIKTANSFLALKATIDWSVTEQNQDGVLNGQFMAEIGKADLFKLIPDMPQEFIQSFPASSSWAFTHINTSEDLILMTRLSYPKSSIMCTLSSALSTMPSAVTPPYFSINGFSREPLLTPTRMGIFRSFAASTTAFTRSVLPILPGLIRILSAPFSMAASAIR